jgi:hypothetical protein
MKIRIGYHIVAQPGWEEITVNCINKMKNSRLWDAATEIHMFCHYRPELFGLFQEQLKDNDKITWHLFTDSIITRGESFSNAKLKSICDADTDEWAVLRLHNKSSNYVNHREREIAYKWRDLIEYWNIERWTLILSKLEQGYDAAGNHWMEEPWPHFSGNVWWAKSSYIKKLPLLPLPVSTFSTSIDLKGWSPRHESEAWVGLADSTHAWSANSELTDWGYPGIGEGWKNYNIPFNNKE